MSASENDAPRTDAPRLRRCEAGTLWLPRDRRVRRPGVTGWTVRTPRGLILADHRERNGWRVAVEGTCCHVYVPDYTPVGKNYRLVLADDGGDAHGIEFDVAVNA